jgi:hypothetical protein
MTRTLRRCVAALAGAVGLGACDLEVQNPNQPERTRVRATPSDLEALLGSYYRRWHDGLYRGLGSVWGMANVQSFENVSSLSNNCQGQRIGIPRAINDNAVGNVCEGEQQRVYFVHSEVVRVASDVLADMAGPAGGTPLTLGSPARDARAKAFAEFLRGVSLGYMAIVYDSAAVVSPTMGTSPEECQPDPISAICTGTLRGYREVMDSALAALQRSIDFANTAGTSSDGFPLPATWIPVPSPQSMTLAEFVRVIRSYRARLRANLARTPAERADVSAGGIVDWDAVIADAVAGITANHENVTNTTTGPFKTWVAQWHTYGLWHQMTPFIIGMADVSGSYANWIAQPLNSRGTTGAFFMITPDLRFPQGFDRASQQADFAVTSCNTPNVACKRYFRNRPSGNDQFAGFGWGWSNYDHSRYHSWATAGDGTGSQNGRMVFIAKAETDLLEAEGQFRKGNYARAAELVNRTRTAGMVSNVATGGGLPPITAFDPTTPVPGGADCVPKMPVSASNSGGGTVTCGNLWEALKYEKRLETIQTHFAAWFLDSRGWGDLAQGTPLHWAVPYQDLQARSKAVYSTGVGTQGAAAAGPSTYGW